MVGFKGAHFEKDIILMCIRRYLAYPLSYRPVEEPMEERGMQNIGSGQREKVSGDVGSVLPLAEDRRHRESDSWSWPFHA
jgi:transposase-like protein